MQPEEMKGKIRCDRIQAKTEREYSIGWIYRLKDKWIKGRLKWIGTKTKCVGWNDSNREAQAEGLSERVKRGTDKAAVYSETDNNKDTETAK